MINSIDSGNSCFDGIKNVLIFFSFAIKSSNTVESFPPLNVIPIEAPNRENAWRRIQGGDGIVWDKEIGKLDNICSI